MQYKNFGRLDWETSILGFGTMRFPTIDNDMGQIDEPEATRMLHYAIDHGVNYIDTAYTYHGENSERFLGRALQGGYRERVKLASKLPPWLVKNRDDLDRIFDDQLEKLQTGSLDFYLLHALNAKHWTNLRNLGVLDWLERKRADGRIKQIGFSFHDLFPTFKEIVDGYDWTFCQIQYNFMDIEYQAGTEGLKYAADKGLAVVIMEPIRGGRLAGNVPPAIQEIWDTAEQRRSPAEWALQWVWNHPEVTLLLSGMSTMEQIQQNIETADKSGPDTLTAQELALFDQVREKYEELCPIPCTGCQYCLPCPSGVNIPRVLDIYNDAVMYNDWTLARLIYNNYVAESNRANNCTECGECLDKCPQQIEIPNWLATAHSKLCKE